MSQGKRTLRLILCGICYKEKCSFSRWVEEDEPDGELIGLLDEIQQLWLMQQHEQIDLYEAGRKTIETSIESDVQTLANETNEVIEVQSLIDGQVYVKQFTPEHASIETDKGSFIDDILNRVSVQVERTNEKQKEH